MTEYVSMHPCIECGEDVPASECYEDFGVAMHAMGVTGQAEPHETGHAPGDLKRVDIQEFATPNIPTPPDLPSVSTPDFRHLVVRDVSAYLMKFGLSEPEAVARTETMLDNAIRQIGGELS